MIDRTKVRKMEKDAFGNWVKPRARHHERFKEITKDLENKELARVFRLMEENNIPVNTFTWFIGISDWQFYQHHRQGKLSATLGAKAKLLDAFILCVDHAVKHCMVSKSGGQKQNKRIIFGLRSLFLERIDRQMRLGL